MVIPKEIRRTQRIRQGDALEIFTADEGEVVFKKYSPLMGLQELAAAYAEVLGKNLGLPVLICDRERALAVAGLPRKDIPDAPVSTGLEKLLMARSVYLAPEDAARRIRPWEKSDKAVLCAAPILVQGDVEGGVCLLGGLPAPAPGAEQSRAAGIAAAFFARWMAE